MLFPVKITSYTAPACQNERSHPLSNEKIRSNRGGLIAMLVNH